LDEDDPRIFGHAEIDRFGHVMDEWRKEHGTEQYMSAAGLYKLSSVYPELL
jgi:protein LTV1